MQPIWIFRHVCHEGPGYFAHVLEQRQIPYRLIAIDQGEAVPGDVRGAGGLVFMGGSMSVNDPLPWIDDSLRLIRQAADVALPVLGHCLGGQLIARALGATIHPNPVKEIGWLPTQVLDNPVAQQWFGEEITSPLLYHWHGETFTLPTDATLILSSTHCRHQGFVAGRMLALQCHVEMTTAMVRDWAQQGAAELYPTSATVQSAQDMLHDLNARVAALHEVADRLYGRWLAQCL